MCGFVGVCDKQSIYNFDISKALKKIYHRGPDDQKMIKLRQGITFGFSRLAIIDLTEAGSQPMSNKDGDITIVFNGEIFNYRELKNQLLEKGHKFCSNSDTEVLVHMYEEYGIAMLEQLEGMYAIALADQRKDKLYLIRDRVGIKPLYYCNKEDVLTFASELKAMFDMPNVSKSISNQHIAEFLQYEYIHAPNTLFSDIKKVLPGHYLEIHNSEAEDVEYWDCCKQPVASMTVEEAEREAVEILRRSLELHLRSDVPIGLFLSGGIDSGILAALASEQIPEVNTYTLRFEENDFDETHLAELVAKKYNTKHHCYTVSAQDMEKLLPEMLWYCDEPLGDSGILPNYIINSLVAKDGIKVVLSGAGGDELFAGYQYYFGSKKEQIVNKFSILSKAIVAFTKGRKPDFARKIEKALLLGKYPEKHMIASEQIFDSDTLIKLLGNNCMFTNRKEAYYTRCNQSGLNGLLYTDIKTYLTDDLMLLADRTTMAHSVEGRVPFLYRPLIEFAMGIPENIKAPKGQRKWLLKRIAKKYLPQELLEAPKRGFCSPVLSWGKGEFGDYAFKILNSESSLKREYWNQTEYQRFVSDKSQYKYNFAQIYLLLILELYMRVHVDHEFSSKENIDLEKIYAE